MASHKPLTVIEVLRETVKRHEKCPALLWKHGNHWHEHNYASYLQEVYLIARGFASLGLQPGEFVTIMGFNCPQWLIADVAAIAAGAVPAGIYTTSSPDQAQYIMHHCGAKIAVVENAKILKKVLAVRESCPNLTHIVVMDNDTYEEEGVLNWRQLRAKADECSQEDLEARIAQQKPSDLATLVYTSGTTSHPKAVMLSHDNLTWTASMVAHNELKITHEDIFLSYLPLSHVAEQMTTIHGPMAAGASVYFAESLDKLPSNLLDVRPTIFLGVPRVWEKIQDKMMQKAAERSNFAKKIAAWAKDIGLKASLDPSVKQSFGYKLANALVYKKVKKALGLDRCRMQFTAAAPITRATLDYFWSLNIPLYEIYGMSECSGPATISLPSGKTKVGSVGPALSGTTVKLAEDGEIIVKGPNVFKGYLHNPDATAACLDPDGSLHSGDLGSFDADGFLHITGRKKDLIITSGGENIAPEMLENQIKGILGVEHAVVIGDRQKYLSLLIALNPNDISNVSKITGSSATSLPELADCKTYRDYVQSCLTEINGKVAQVQTIKSFAILPNSFSEESGELTPTMKVKRNFVAQKYQDKITELYS